MSKRKASSPFDADDVLAGRVKPGATDLLQLIHRENPTGRELPARETEARYARKARLQSLLVHRFADELEVALDPAQPGTVSLRHRGHGRDACHAVLAALDDDARSWVQRELDLAASAPPESPVPAARPKSGRTAALATKDDGAGAIPDTLVERAEAALAAYDYEGAREALEQALGASQGGAGPAAALLALLVDTLGDDVGALAIEPKITKAALAEVRVRAPLALAAARSGQETRALGMVRGLDDARSATVFVGLAASALTAGDVDRATRHLEQAKRYDAACAEILGVADEVAKARAKACEPAEAEITALLAAGSEASAEKQAAVVLARWPESAVARRALREIEERRRKREARQRAEEAEGAAARGESTVALALLAQAAATARGAERDAIERRTREIEQALRTQRDAERVEQAIRALEAGDPRAGLTIYAGLEEALRVRVRARSARPELAWIDRMTGTRGGDRLRVEAALAMEGALAALARDPQAALALLAPHEAALERVPEAGRIAREAEAALRAGRLARARAAIDGARAELAAGAAAEALARLEAVSSRDLPDDERAIADTIEAAARHVVERRRRHDEARRLRSAGRLFEARALVEGLATGAEAAEERSRFEHERDAIRAEIQRSFRVDVDDAPRSAEDLGRFRPHTSRSAVPSWLTADGRGIVIARAHERWVVVRVLHRATMRVHVTILLRTPEPMGDVDTQVCGPTLWLTGGRGALLEIAMAGWEVRDFRPSSDVSAPTDIVETAVLVTTEDPAAPRHFWVACRTRGDVVPERLRVIDLAQHRTVRELSDVWQAVLIAGLDEPRVALVREKNCTVYTPRGVMAPHGRLDLALGIQEIAAHPTGEGFVALVCEPVSDDLTTEVERSLYVATISPTGRIVHQTKLPDGDPDRPSCVAARRGSSHVHGIWGDESGYSLFAVTCDDHAPAELYAVGISYETMLVQDAGARRIVALTVHDGGVDAAELGPLPPELPMRPPRPSVEIPGNYDVLSCDQPSGERDAAALALATAWRGSSDARIIGMARDLEQLRTVTPERLVEVVFTLRKNPTRVRQEESARLVQRLVARFPGHPEVRLLQANACATDRRWTAAREALTGVGPSSFDEARAQHLHHLRALIALDEGRFAEATTEVTEALAREGRCDLVALTSLTDAASLAMRTDADESSPTAQLFAILRAADACFLARDPGGARRALDVPLVWSVRERQSLARLAEAYLAFTPGSRVEHVRKLVTLGALLDDVDEGRSLERRNIPFPGAWDAARVADVAARARSWLDAQGLQERSQAESLTREGA